MSATPERQAGDSPANRLDWAVERELHRLRPHRPRRLTPQERRVELVAVAVFAAAAVALIALMPSERPFQPLLAAVLVLGYAAASRVRVHVGGGFTMPTQLVLVPMLFWLPATAAPLMVACGLVLAAAADVALGRAHPERVLTAPADGLYSIGAAAVFAVAGEPDADALPWLVVAGAVVAQSLVDLLTSTAREWLGRGVTPAMQLRVIVAIFILDLCLTPVAVLLAARDAFDPAAVGAAIALLAFLAAIAADRRARVEELTDRLDELEEERHRRDLAIRAVGEAYGSTLDRARLVELAVSAATEAFGADRGRATVGAEVTDCGGQATDEALLAAEAAARRDGRPAVVAVAGRFAVAQPLSAVVEAPTTADVVSLSRAGRAFTEREQRLFGYLVGQLAVAMDNLALHERVSHEARTDALTGLPNHRAFQEALAAELDRTSRFSRPVSLAMIDIDAFKAINDTYGHQRGDEVLRQIAGAIQATCRATDMAARYGGEEFAVILTETDAHGAVIAAEGLRREIERLRVPLPDGGALSVTVSIGVASTAARGVDPAAVIAAADAALYSAKRGGKNRTVSAVRT